jgi:hypothetical protein
MLKIPNSGRLAELDIVSYGRRGRHTPLQFNAGQLDQIARTVRGVPEVMIKVSGGGKSPDAVQAHFSYIDRHGKLDVYTDDGERLHGKSVADHLVDDWNLESARGQYRPHNKGGQSDPRSKQVYNIVFSMPGGTPPDKLLAATQKFAREKFALRHRYAMVLHTDQAHPHVHLVVKAQSEESDRLYIRKATLRQWREDFAAYLRELGVPANATPTALRGKSQHWKLDGIYRTIKRGQSTFMRRKAETVAEELRRGRLTPELGKAKLIAARAKVVGDWTSTAAVLRAQGQESLIRDIQEYVRRMPDVATEKELLGRRLVEYATVRRTQSARRE